MDRGFRGECERAVAAAGIAWVVLVVPGEREAATREPPVRVSIVAATGSATQGHVLAGAATVRLPAMAPAAAEPPDISDGPDTIDRPDPPPGVHAPGARYAWPLHPPPAVLVPFRAPAHPYAPGHRGVDLAGTVGQAVLAARGGTVAFAGPIAGRGVVSVQHDDGLRTTYEPVRPVVPSGAIVRAGDVLGLLEAGHPGCPSAACLHWGVRRDRVEYLDPLVLLRPPRVRLLPVPDPWPLAE